MTTKEAKATLNILRNSNIEINCRASIKSAQEQALVDNIVQIVKLCDTHIDRIRFDRNPKSYGSTGTRFVKQSFYPTEKKYELYVNLAKVSNRKGDYVFADESRLFNSIRNLADRSNNTKFINRMNKKYNLNKEEA